MTKLAIIEKNNTIRKGVKAYLAPQKSYECVADVNDYNALQSIPSDVDVILFDIDELTGTLLETISTLEISFTKARLIAFTTFEESEALSKALIYGANGYLVKKTPPAQFFSIIDEIMKRQSRLSSYLAMKLSNVIRGRKSLKREFIDKEIRILEAMIEGNSYKVIVDRYKMEFSELRECFHDILLKLHKYHKNFMKS